MTEDVYFTTTETLFTGTSIKMSWDGNDDADENIYTIEDGVPI